MASSFLHRKAQERAAAVEQEFGGSVYGSSTYLASKAVTPKTVTAQGMDDFSKNLKSYSDAYNSYASSWSAEEPASLIEQRNNLMTQAQQYRAGLGIGDRADYFTNALNLLRTSNPTSVSEIYKQYGSAGAYNTAVRDSELRKKYSGKTYDELQSILKGMRPSQDPDYEWLKEYASSPSVMKSSDYDKAIAQTEEQLQWYKDHNEVTDFGSGNVSNFGGFSAQRKYDDQIKELEKELEKYKTGKWTSDREEKYNSLMANPDFLEKAHTIDNSRANTFGVMAGDKYFGIGDAVYTYINNINGEQSNDIRNGDSEDGYSAAYQKYRFLTQDEKNTYNYLYQTDGKKAANEYLDFITPKLNERRMSDVVAKTAEFASAHPGMASINSVASNMVSGIGMLDIAAQNIRRSITGDYRPIDYNTLAMTPTNLTTAVRGTVAQDLADWSGTINLNEEDHPFWARVLNGKSLGDVYQLGMSMVDSWAVSRIGKLAGDNVVTRKLLEAFGTSLLGGSAASQGVLEALSKGATDEQALAMGVLNGAFETLFEYVSIDRLLGDGGGNLAKGILLQGLAEGSEEMNTTLANTVAEILVMAEKSDYKRAIASYIEQGKSPKDAARQAVMDVAINMGWDAIGGMLTGGIMGGTHATINRVAENAQYSSQYGDSIRELVAESLDIDPGNEMAQRILDKLDAGRSVSGNSIRRLVNQNESSIRTQDSKAIKSAVEERLTSYGEQGDVASVASAITKSVAGEKLSLSEKSTIKNSRYAQRVLNELNTENIESGDFASDWAESIGTERINPEAYSRLVQEAEAENQTPTMNVAGLSDSVSRLNDRLSQEQKKPALFKRVKSEVTEDNYGDSYESAEAEAPKAEAVDQQTAVQQKQAVPVSAAEQTGPAQTQKQSEPVTVESASKAYGHQAAAFVHTYKMGQDVLKYDQAYRNAYEFGQAGVPFSTVQSLNSVSYLNQDQIDAAYSAGRDAAQKQAEDRAGSVSSNKTSNESSNKDVQTKAPRRIGTVSAVGVSAKEMRSKFNDPQNRAYKVLTKIAEATGIDIVLYDSKTDALGNFTESEGRFSWSDNKIYIDINAGLSNLSDAKSVEKYAMLRTFSHEFTHFMEKFDPQGYDQFKQIIFNALAEKLASTGGETSTTVDDLIQQKLDKYQGKLGENFKYDDAAREVVADAMTDMLPQSSFMQTLYEENKTLFQKVVDKLKEFISDLKKYFSQITVNNKQEARLLQEERDGMLKYAQEIVDAWDKLALTAVQNYQDSVSGESVDSIDSHEASTAKISGTADGAVAMSEFTDKLADAGMSQMQVRTEEEAFPKMIMSITGGDNVLVTADKLPGLSSSPVMGLINGKEVPGFTGRQIRNYVMKNNGFSTEQRKNMNSFMKEMGDFMKEAGITYKFIGLQDVQDAKLHYNYNPDGSIKSIILSAMVKNGEYPINFDLTSICKKRVAMSSLIEKLSKRGSLDSGIVDLKPENIFKINVALKNAGYETACLGCFVESKRYNVQDWAVKFCNKYNSFVKKINPNATYFDYGNGSQSDVSVDRAVQFDEAAKKFNEESKVKRLDKALKKYREKAENGEVLIKGKTVNVFGETIENTFPKAQRERIEESETLSEELKQKYLNIDVTTLTIDDVEVLLENGILPGAAASNKMNIESLIKSGEAYQHLIRPSDLLTVDGMAQLEKLPNFRGVLYGHYGSGTPKLIQGFTPYNSEIALLNDKKGDMSLAEYLYTIAGVRMQSFSDFQIQNIYDYLQMVGDLAARKLPAHAYTKEVSFAKLLGMTGIKTNLSVMFDIDFNVDPRHAGLTRYDPSVHTGEYAKIVLHDEQGDWVYNIGDYATQQAYEKAYPGRTKRFIQSIGFADAVRLQTSDGYTANCGIIGVGFSDLNILAMLNDPRIRYIIPYHASSLPDVIKKATNIILGTDYTSWQNTTKIKGITDANDKKVEWSFKEATKRLGSAKAALNELNDHIKNDGWKVETKKSQNGHGTFGLYEDLQATSDPKKTAENFFEWCASNNTLPLFYQFAGHENYYKLLYDFNVYDCVTEEYAPQHEVQNIYPTRDASGNIVAGNATESFDTGYLIETINKQMSSMNRYFENLDKDLDSLAENVEKGKYEIGNSQSDYDGKTQYEIRYPSYTEEDIRKNSVALQKMDSVGHYTGNELGNRSIKLDERVRTFFDSIGNNVYSDQFGDVSLLESSLKSEFAHGITPTKVMTFAAIPNVIRSGVVIYTLKKNEHGLERIVVAAPVTVGDPAEKMYVAVMLQRDPQSQRLYLHDVVTEKEFSKNSGEHLITHRGSDAVDEELYTTDILRIALNVKDDVSQSGSEIKEQNQLRDSVSENGLEDLRKERSDLEERIDMAYFNDVSDAEIRKMENRLVKVNHEIDKIVAEERKASVLTPMQTIVDNLSKYRRSDLESLAEQISEGAWDGYEELSREDLEDGIRDAIMERELSPLEMQSRKFGLYVKPVSNDNQYQIRESNLSNRDVLRQAAQLAKTSTRFTEPEKATLHIFQARLNKLDQAEAKRQELLAQKREILNGRDPKELDAETKKQFRAVQNNLDTVNGQIRRFDADLLQVEHQKVLQEVLKKSRVVVDRDAKKRGIEQLEAYKNKQRETASSRKFRTSIADTAMKMSDWLKTNSDKAHVPEILKAPVAEILESIDFSSKRYLNGGEMTKADQKFASNLMTLKSLIDGQTGAINGDENAIDQVGAYLDISAENREFLNNLAVALANIDGTFTINKMTNEQLESFDKFLKNLSRAIRQANVLLANARYKNLPDMAKSSMKYFESMGNASEKQGTKLAKFLQWEQATPYYAFKRFGEAGTTMFESFARGWERLAFNAKSVIDFTEKLYKPEEIRKWRSTVKTFTLENGSKISMTVAQIMELSQLLGREQAMKHILAGGIRIGNYESKKGTVQDVNHYHLSVKDINSILGSLGKREAYVARQMQRYMADQGAKWGNAISMARFGYEFYTEGPMYYPIRTDSNGRPMRDTDEQGQSMFRLLNLSASKSLNPKANNALIVGDIFDTFADHMSDMAKLNALGLPILDAIKWYNFTEKQNERPDGSFDMNGVKKSMEKAFGTAAGSYFRTLIKDINGVKEAGDRGGNVASRIISNYKVAAVAANLRVALLQPTSYVRAMYILKPKNMIAAFGSKNAYNEAMQYSGTAVWKSLGYYDTDIARSMRSQIEHDETWKDKVVEKSMGLAELGDKVTWGRLWVACKMEAKDRNSKLSGEALKRATADIFREVVYATQVMDSTLTRSEMMRGGTTWTKLATAFGAEPTLSANILMDAASQYSIEKNRTNAQNAWKKTKDKILLSFLTYVSAASFSALIESIADAFRDDDDYETMLQKIQQAFLGEKLIDGNLGQDLTIIGKIPVLKNVINTLQGSKSSDMSIASIESISNAFKIWKETIQLEKGLLEKPTSVTWNGKMTTYGKIYKTLQALSQTSGLAVANLTRDVIAVWNTTVGSFVPDLKLKTYDPGKKNSIKYAFLDGLMDDKTAMMNLVMSGEAEDDNAAYWMVHEWETGNGKYDALLDAVKGNDIDAFSTAYTELAEHGVAEDDINSKIKSEIKEEFLGKDDQPAVIGRSEAEGMLQSLLGMDADDAYFTANGWELGTTSNYAKVYDAMQTGGDVNAAISEMVEHGYSEKDVIGQVVSKIGDLYKGTDKDAASISASEAASMLIKYGKLSKEDADKKVAAWTAKRDTGYNTSDIGQALKDGEITQEQAEKMWVEYGGLTAEKAHSKAVAVVLDSKYPGWSGLDNAASKYQQFGKGIFEESAFIDAMYGLDGITGVDANGDGKMDSRSEQKNKWAYINSLPISNEQKDALHLACGYSAGRLSKTPWHQ